MTPDERRHTIERNGPGWRIELDMVIYDPTVTEATFAFARDLMVQLDNHLREKR